MSALNRDNALVLVMMVIIMVIMLRMMMERMRMALMIMPMMMMMMRKRREDAALKDVEKGGEEECPSVRTTHAAPDYQEFTAPHSAYSLDALHCLPHIDQYRPTFCIEPALDLQCAHILPHSA